MPSKASTYGLVTQDLTAKLNKEINEDFDERKRKLKLLDEELAKKLYAVCSEEVQDPIELLCVMRRFMTCRFGCSLEEVDRVLEGAGLIAAQPALEMATLR